MSADRNAIQNEIVPLLLLEIVTHLKQKDTDDLIALLDDLNISNDMIKEHLSILSLDAKIIDQLTNINSGVKAGFTRAYNKTHQAITRKRGGKKKETSEESDEEEEEESVLIDEEELKEIRAAKRLEKEQRKQMRAIKNLEKFSVVQLTEGVS